MSDMHALVLEHGGQRLIFKCSYATLLKLEANADWRALMADAMGFQKASALIEIASIFTGVPPADIIALSPPVADVQRCITGAWSLCMEGPEGLRRYQDAVAKEAAADAGKPERTANVGWGEPFWTTLRRLWSRVFRRPVSGA
ncbi:MAG: hypothetical protein IPK75_12800 [Acidobacteria bacterium]|nr:hypothetical protein [Acidobacteriota bacterium]